MRYFNTSGPNNPKEHYTLPRENLISEGIKLVEKDRYFTIWAPRQTGKSTYFRLLAKELEKTGYKVTHINVENYLDASKEIFLNILSDELKKGCNIKIMPGSFTELERQIKKLNNKKCILIIDEIEGLNPELFGQFLHTIRNLYHYRNEHCLKSVILVGVTNIIGIIQDNASPFNIADNLEVPYFTNNETFELLHQHETETGQLFQKKLKQKISEITAGQPGLVNGFAKRLVDESPEKKKIIYSDYLKVEDWYLTKVIDKNVANIINKATKHREFVEKLLFTEKEIPFKIDRPAIKDLHTNGLITHDKNNNVEFWVPLYKKRLYDAFYPYSNGENTIITRNIYAPDYFTDDRQLNIPKLIKTYKEYVKRRGFNAFREKDENGNYKSIKEAALIYSFETYIQAFLQQAKGKSYREAYTGLGKSDLIINIEGREFLFETKIYYGYTQFVEGKAQLSYYCRSLGLKKGLYLVFTPNNVNYPEQVKEQSETIKKTEIITYLIPYDEEKDF